MSFIVSRLHRKCNYCRRFIGPDKFDLRASFIATNSRLSLLFTQEFLSFRINRFRARNEPSQLYHYGTLDAYLQIFLAFARQILIKISVHSSIPARQNDGYS